MIFSNLISDNLCCVYVEIIMLTVSLMENYSILKGCCNKIGPDYYSQCNRSVSGHPIQKSEEMYPRP